MNVSALFFLPHKTLLLGAALLATTASLQAQMGSLEELFVENFEKGLLLNDAFKVIPSGKFRVGESKQDGVTVSGACQVVRPIRGGTLMTWTLALDFPPIEKQEESPAVAEFGFILADAKMLGFKLTWSQTQQGASIAEISAGSLSNKGRGADVSKTLRSAWKQVPLTDGPWVLTYNQGAISLKSPDGIEFLAYDDPQDGIAVPVIGLLWKHGKGPLRCRNMTVQAAGRPLDPDPSGAASLRKAAELNRHAQALGRGGNWAAAVDEMRESAALFLKVRGRDHRDHANAVSNLAGMLSNSGQIEASLSARDEAVGLYEKIVGRNHPACAQELSMSATLLLELKRTRDAQERLEEALSIYAKYLDENDTMLSSLKGLIGTIADARAAKQSAEQDQNGAK